MSPRLTHRTLLEQIGTNSEIGVALWVDHTRVSHWRRTGIPAEHWVGIAMLARQHGIDITAEQVAQAAPRHLRSRLSRVS